MFKSKLNITVGDCPVTIGYGGIHGAIPFYQEQEQDAPVTDKDIIYRAKPKELIEALTAVLAMRADWYESPKGEATDEEPKDESKRKYRKPKKRMKAYDMYQTFVGEIGIPRREFLFHIRFWEARRILQGYSNRQRAMWSSTRWMTYNIMWAMPYLDLKKAGIMKPTDLIKFPWDETDIDLPTDDEIQESIDEINALNAMMQKTDDQ